MNRASEIKSCQNKQIIDETGKLNSSNLIRDSNNIIEFKKSHIYFTQCQILMYCCSLKYCDFFIYSEHFKLILMVVNRDDIFKKNTVQKLGDFYFKLYFKKNVF